MSISVKNVLGSMKMLLFLNSLPISKKNRKRGEVKMEILEIISPETKLSEVCEKLEKYRRLFPNREIVFDIENSAIIMK